MYTDENATVLKREEVSPNIAPRPGVSLAPTVRTVYACPCGAGTITDARVPGFCDHWATIDCPICRDRYDILTGCGHMWELRPK